MLKNEEKKATVEIKQVSDDQPGATDEKGQKLLVNLFFKKMPFSVCFFDLASFIHYEREHLMCDVSENELQGQ